MKKLGVRILTGLVIISHFFQSCEKRPIPDVLPEFTTSGKNTFGCYINGEAYIPVVRRFICCEGQPSAIITDYIGYPVYEFNVSTIRAVDEEDTVNDAAVRINIMNPEKEAEYKVNYAIVKYNKNYYYVDPVKKGSVRILKLDTVNHIISGKFTFKAYNSEDMTDSVSLTDGRFDLKY